MTKPRLITIGVQLVLAALYGASAVGWLPIDVEWLRGMLAISSTATAATAMTRNKNK